MSEKLGVQVPARAVAAAAEAAWGPHWQSQMIRHLGMDRRRVDRVAAAARDGAGYTLPRDLLERLLGCLEAQFLPMQRAHEDLRDLVENAPSVPLRGAFKD